MSLFVDCPVFRVHNFDDALDLFDELCHKVGLEEYRYRKAGEMALGINFFYVQLLDVYLLAEHGTRNAVERARGVL